VDNVDWRHSAREASVESTPATREGRSFFRPLTMRPGIDVRALGNRVSTVGSERALGIRVRPSRSMMCCEECSEPYGESSEQRRLKSTTYSNYPEETSEQANNRLSNTFK
jgi:hypothetical protein